MHMLHRILVHKVNQQEGDRNDVIADARYDAESQTERYADRVYDWRETDSAGRWADIYPENVMLSSDSLQKFISELEDVRNYQVGEILRYAKRIREQGFDSVEKLVACYQQGEVGRIPYWELKQLAEFLYGEYTFDSGFFNIYQWDARVTAETIEEVTKSPNEWALVMFDYHI